MSFTIKLLRNGNPEILRYYAEANKIWDVLLENFKGNSEELAHQLRIQQTNFEEIVQDSHKHSRRDGQEIMVFTGLAYYLDDESEAGYELAASVADAFEMSLCSLEVKGFARRAAKIFYLGG